MVAREKFKKGDRVRESALYPRTRYPKLCVVTGTIVGFGYKGTTVAVVRDGTRTPAAYHLDFWERDEPAPDADAKASSSDVALPAAEEGQ